MATILKAKSEFEKQTYSSEENTPTKTMQVVSTRVFPQIQPILYMACCSMLLATMIQAGMAAPLSSDYNNTSILESIIKQAVSTSLTDTNSTKDCNITSSLTKNLISIMQNRGIELNYRGNCTPQTSEKLQSLFLGYYYRSPCVTLTKVNMPGEDGDKEVFVVTTTSDCVNNLRLSPRCFPFPGKAHCTTSTKIEYLSHLGEDYFPRFIASVECEGCKRGDQECLQSGCGYVNHRRSYYLLKRVPNRCDEDGRDVWEIDQERRKVNVACSCY